MKLKFGTVLPLVYLGIEVVSVVIGVVDYFNGNDDMSKLKKEVKEELKDEILKELSVRSEEEP